MTPLNAAKSQGPDPASGEGPWAAVTAWRKTQRARLLAERQGLPPALRQRMVSLILELIYDHLSDLRGARIGLYWPFRAEIDIRSLADYGLQKSAEFALPVVVKKNAPLEFHRWLPGDRLTAGVWNIPVPAVREVLSPDVLLVPLLGHDGAGFRLGYGGGYYDRTIAAMAIKPHTVGIGYAHAKLESIRPQPHDVPMNAILTEDGITSFDHDTRHHASAQSRVDKGKD